MMGIFAWASAVAYIGYLWHCRKIYTIDRCTIVLAGLLMIIAVALTM